MQTEVVDDAVLVVDGGEQCAAVLAGGVRECLQPHGDFRTFQYVHAYGMRAARRFRKLMDDRFQSFERIGPVIRNVPPAFVLRYWGPR